ncbi:glycosyltransferase [Pseudoalteromonas sp. T1lg76]|uniref:glycosyltransferase n=1 Tax=Pseudoalteromonas sp. T1lg76 TaxID=2077103 RepID=UPI000CF601B5|nr:glycosyltransferase [Pseudoalteromonas sp. T1lg76]
MNHKAHILVLPSWYPRYKGDVVGSFFREQAIALSKYGHQVGVIFPEINSLKKIFNFNVWSQQIEKDDDVINTYRYRFFNMAPKCRTLSIKSYLQKGEALYQHYVKTHGKPDIIHVHSLLNAGVLAHYLSGKYDIPYVVTEHQTAFARGLYSAEVFAELKPVVSQASKCIAVSNEFKTLLNEQFNTKKWAYIPNIVNDSFFSSEIPPKKSRSDTLTIINVCFLDKKKRLDVLIKAFSQLNGEYPLTNLVIGGDGPEKENLIALAQHLGVAHKVSFLGMLTREQVKTEMIKADLFALTSEYETFGVVLVEALALGKPVLSTRSGGPESIVIEDVGTLVDKNDALAVYQGLKEMLGQWQRYNAHDIRSYCQKNFSEQAVVRQLTMVYDEILVSEVNE